MHKYRVTTHPLRPAACSRVPGNNDKSHGSRGQAAGRRQWGEPLQYRKIFIKWQRASWYVGVFCAAAGNLHAETLPFKPEPVPASSWWSIGIALLAIAAILLYGYFKNTGKYRPTGAANVVEQFNLGPGTRAYIVVHKQQELLIVDNRQHIAIQKLSSSQKTESP